MNALRDRLVQLDNEIGMVQWLQKAADRGPEAERMHRAFLEEREARRAKGRNWLFFGDQKRATDFLYEDELIDWQRRGILTRLDTAFSRDQTDKIYVQHRMRENARELWSWLEAGAHFYVCGDAQRMAKDVEDTLLRIAAEQGGKGDGARAWLDGLVKAGRYQRDVY